MSCYSLPLVSSPSTPLGVRLLPYLILLLLSLSACSRHPPVLAPLLFVLLFLPMPSPLPCFSAPPTPSLSWLVSSSLGLHLAVLEMHAEVHIRIYLSIYMYICMYVYIYMFVFIYIYIYRVASRNMSLHRAVYMCMYRHTLAW